MCLHYIYLAIIGGKQYYFSQLEKIYRYWFFYYDLLTIIIYKIIIGI